MEAYRVAELVYDKTTGRYKTVSLSLVPDRFIVETKLDHKAIPIIGKLFCFTDIHEAYKFAAHWPSYPGHGLILYKGKVPDLQPARAISTDAGWIEEFWALYDKCTTNKEVLTNKLYVPYRSCVVEPRFEAYLTSSFTAYEVEAIWSPDMPNKLIYERIKI